MTRVPASTPANAGRLTRRRLIGMALTSVGMAPVLTACASVTAEERVLIQMTADNRFAPSGVTIPLGSTVVWQNASTGRHTATCDPALAEAAADVVLPAGAAAWGSGDLYTGQTWEHTFTTPGTYLYFCRHHEREGMLGTIAVAAGQGAGEPDSA
jgi:plastocyanin